MALPINDYTVGKNDVQINKQFEQTNQEKL